MIIVFMPLYQLIALPIMYAEQYYELYHLNLYRYPENYNENLVYLELALDAPFKNPINAIARVENKKEYEYYQALFKMHCNLKLTESYRYLGGEYDKRKAYWFNAPFKDINLKGLKKAEHFYTIAELYWKEAIKWSDVASKYHFIDLEEISQWMDESWRIQNGDLNYGKYIGKDLARVSEVRADFEAMDETTFPLYPGQHPLNEFFERRSIEQIKKDNDNRPIQKRKRIKGLLDRMKEEELTKDTPAALN